MIRTIARYGVRYAPGTTRNILKTWLGGSLVSGPHIAEFEKAFANYHGMRHAISASYGRMAFYYILRALDLKPDSEIIFPALTFWVIPELARVAGFRPVFVDIDPATYNLDAKLVEAAITEKTRAIVPTHLYGQPSDLDPILRLAEQHNLTVIEDCAHAIGATYNQRKVGSFGKAAFFSFQMLKGLNTYSGGMAITDDNDLANRIRKLAEAEPWPSTADTLKKLASGLIQRILINPYLFTFTGFLAFYIASFWGDYDLTRFIWEKIRPLDPLPEPYRRRYTNIQALIGLELLKRLDEFIHRNQDNAHYLTEKLAREAAIQTPTTIQNGTHVFYQYCVRVSDPITLSRRAIRHGIDLEIMHVDICSGLDFFAPFKSYCPVAESTASTLQFPVYASLRPKDTERILKVIKQAVVDLPPLAEPSITKNPGVRLKASP